VSTPRRTVLCGLLLGVAAPGALAACDGAGVRKGGAGDAKPGAVLAKASDIPVGGGALVNSGSNGLLLIDQSAAGQFRAFDPTCPHAGAIVQPPQNGVITCPAHGSQFNPATGALVQGPAPNGLNTVAIRAAGQNVALA
jgi:Rieske Fe-S protein